MDDLLLLQTFQTPLSKFSSFLINNILKNKQKNANGIMVFFFSQIGLTDHKHIDKPPTSRNIKRWPQIFLQIISRAKHEALLSRLPA